MHYIVSKGALPDLGNVERGVRNADLKRFPHAKLQRPVCYPVLTDRAPRKPVSFVSFMSFTVKESCISVEVLTFEPFFNVSVWLEIHVVADVPRGIQRPAQRK